MESERSKVDRDEHLWRRIHETHFVKAQNRVSTAAFKNLEMSVDIARLQGDMRVTLKDGVASSGPLSRMTMAKLLLQTPKKTTTRTPLSSAASLTQC